MGRLRRVRIEIYPIDCLTQGSGVLHKMRVDVESNTNSYGTDVILTEDDFTSRFDWIFDHCIRAIKYEFQRHKEHVDEAEEARASAAQSQARKINGEASGQG